MATKSPWRTTVADLLAAAELGALDPGTEVVTAAEAAAAIKTAAEEVATELRAEAQAQVATVAARALSTAAHECGIPGCKHGAAHGPTQPDRQVKLACPNCGAVARMTARALSRAQGITCVADGGTFAVAERRTYRRAAVK